MSNNITTFKVSGEAELNIQSMLKSLDTLQKATKGLNLSKGIENEFTNLFDKINSAMGKFATQSHNIVTDNDARTVLKTGQTILSLINELQTKVRGLKDLPTEELEKMFSSEVAKKITLVTKKIKEYDKRIEKSATDLEDIQKKLKTAEDKQKALNGELENTKKKLKAINDARPKAAYENATALKNAQKELKILEEKRALMDEEGSKATKGDKGNLTKRINLLKAEIEASEKAIPKIKEYDANNKDEIAKLNALKTSLNSSLATLKTNIIGFKEEIKKLPSNQTIFKIVREDLEKAGISFDNITNDSKGLQTILDNLSAEGLQQVLSNINDLDVSFEETNASGKQFNKTLAENADELKNIENTTKDVENLRDTMLHFFSLSNGWDLLRRSMHEAFETVKELDAAMTEIAVVSDYTLDQVWAMRQQYSKAATEIGAKTIDLVDAQKLYVQQGLDLNEAMEVGIETTKMARIANLNGTEATNLMTAALRGFKMEMTEANRVNDVYSQLAAKSAADTNEIAQAMSRTASIANSAGASFENMSAFLTQIIETTRESAETAGTAMKTIIARFQELKKPMSEIQDVDGEHVDANKIEAALAEAGVALRDAKGEFRAFDEVILELSGKWNNLDVMTQRYIATMAAGSRQQSRFLALMADNERLAELTGYAMNSAGVAQQQYEKTLDSLEAKMNKLKNAASIFFTNLFNNEIIKQGIDLLTNLLETVNNINSALGNGKIGSLIQLGVAAAGFKVASKGLDKIFAKMLGNIKEINSSLEETGKIHPFEGMKKSIKELNGDFLQLIKAKKDFKEKYDSIDETSPVFGAERKGEKRLYKNTLDTFGPDVEETLGGIGLEGRAKKTALKTMSADQLISIAEAEDKASTATEILTNNTKQLTLAELIHRKGMGKGTALYVAQQLAKVQNTFATRENTVAINTNTASTWGNVAAQYALLWPLGLAVGVFAAVAGSAYLLAKAYETDAERAERLARTTELAGNIAKEANDNFNTLLEGREKYSELENTFKNLVTGTFEWNQKLVEANELVLSLAEKFPSLMSFLQIKENGLLSISDEGWEEVISKQQAFVKQAQTNKFLTQSAEQSNTIASENKQKKEDLLKGKGYSVQTETKIDSFLADYQKFIKNPTMFEEGFESDDPDVNNARVRLSHIEHSTTEDLVNQVELIKASFDNLDKALENISQGSLQSYSKQLIAQDQDLQSILKKEYDVDKRSRIVQSYESIFAGSNFSFDAKDHQEDDRYVKNGTWWRKEKNLADRYISLGGSEEVLESEEFKEKNWHERKAYLGELVNQQIVSNDANEELEVIKELANTDETFSAILERDLDQINKIVNTDNGTTWQANLEKVLTKQGLSGSVLGENLSKSISNEQEKLTKEISTVTNRSTALFGKDFLLYEKNYSKQDSPYGYNEDNDLKQKRKALELYDKINNVSIVGSADLAKIFRTEDLETSADVYDAFKDINFDSAVEGYNDLNKIINTTTGSHIELASAILETSTAFNKTSQAKEVFSSIDEKSMKKLFEDGKIDSTELGSLAKEIPNLKMMMDNTGVSISGLAHYFNLLKEGELDAADAASDFLSVLEKINASKNSIEDAFSFIDNFEPSRTQTEIGDKWSEMDDSMQELFDRGAFGDKQLQDYAIAFMGQNNYDKSIKENGAKATYEQALKIANGGENFYTSWQQYAQSGTNMVSTGANGQIDFNMANIGSIENLRKDFAARMGVSEDFANAAIADAQTYSESLASELDKQSKIEGLAEWASKAIKPSDNSNIRILSKKQADIMARELGIEVDQLQTQLQDMMPDGIKLNFEDLIDAEGNPTEYLNKTIQDMFIKDGIEGGKNSFDLSGTYKLMIDAGMNTDQANAALQDMIFDTNGQLKDMDFMINGEKLEGEKEVVEQKISTAIAEGTLDPKVAAAQALSAAKQSKDLASGVARGVAAGFVHALTAGLDSIPQGIRDFLGIDEKINATATSAMNKAGATVDAALQRDIDEASAVYTAALSLPDAGVYKAVSSKASSLIGAPNNASAYTVRGAQDTEKDKKGKKGKTSKEKEPWKADYDWLYNTVKKTNAELRKRNKLEWEYGQYLKDNSKTAASLLNNVHAQESSLKRQQDLNDYEMKWRKKEVDKIQSENSKYSKYAWYDKSIGEVQINWSAIDAQSGKASDEWGKGLDEYIKDLEEVSGKIDGLEDRQMSIIDELQQIKELGRNEYMSVEERVYQAIIDIRQQEIDKLTDINETINTGNTEMLEKLQLGIDEYREDRQNQEDLDNIREMENRLALMRTDTSGANALDILKLEEELDQARQDYMDNQIDQALDELSRQNELAYEQRQRQIDVLTEQLEADQQNGVIAAETNRLMAQALSGSEDSLIGMLKQTEVFQGMAAAKQEDWIKTITEGIKAGDAYWKNEHGLDDMVKNGELAKYSQVTFTDKYGNKVTGKVQGDGTVYANGKLYSGVYKGPDGKYIQDTTGSSKNYDPNKKPATNNKPTNTTPSSGGSSISSSVKNKVSAAIWRGTLGWGYGDDRQKKLSSVFGPKTAAQIRDLVNRGVGKMDGSSDVNNYSYSKMKAKKWKKYKTGGFADYTGPAWLDGTKARPEAVLNAQQTQNFIALRDTLDSIKGINAKSGDNYYDIHIDVDQISNDYDVEKMMEKMQKIIVDNASYRNVNAIDLGRR